MLYSRNHLALLATACAVFLTGCGVAIDGKAPTAAGSAISGQIHGGQQPVSGAALTLYAAGLTGLGQGATSLLKTPVSTSSTGFFNITNDYTCPSATTQVYLVARGGNPGLAKVTSNPASVMMAALGDCGNLPTTSFISMDEVTTAAAAWALAPFFGSNAIIGATPTNATGLRNAFLVAANLSNTATGTAPGNTVPVGAVVETAKVNTLADIISTCVNSDGGATCSPLFSASTNAGVVPTNTLDAALAIVRHPGANVAAVFNTAPPSGPFQPVLATAPNDWTMSIAYTGGGLYLPTALAVDSSGNLWAANYYGISVTELSPAGVPAAAVGFPDPALYENYGLAIDPQNNVWVTNEEGNIGNYNGSLSKFSSTGTVLSGSGFAAGGIYYPYSVTADTDGSIWVADNGDSTATHLANDGTTLAGSGYTSSSLPFPTWVAVDSSHNAWFAATGAAVKITPNGQTTRASCCRAPSSILVDQNGNIWVSDYSASALVQLNASGTVLQSLTSVGGLTMPQGIAIDGAGNIFAANYRGNTFTAVSTATNGAASTILSPSTGFGVDAKLGEPFGTAVDASGNVWISSFSNDTVTQFIGLATPVRTPVNGPPTTP